MTPFEKLLKESDRKYWESCRKRLESRFEKGDPIEEGFLSVFGQELGDDPELNTPYGRFIALVNQGYKPTLKDIAEGSVPETEGRMSYEEQRRVHASAMGCRTPPKIK